MEKVRSFISVLLLCLSDARYTVLKWKMINWFDRVLIIRAGKQSRITGKVRGHQITLSWPRLPCSRAEELLGWFEAEAPPSFFSKTRLCSVWKRVDRCRKRIKKKDEEDMRVKQTYGGRFPECREVLIPHHSSSQKIKYWSISPACKQWRR